MKITVESTTKIVELDGVPCRIWEGQTASGVRVHCFIPRIAAKDDQDLSQFEAELQETIAPSEAVAVYPLRLIL